jgi:hypothetical protein
LQHVHVVGENLRDFERADPEGVKLVVFAFILSRCIPLKYQIPDLELFLLDLPVESLFDLLLMTISCIPHLFLDMLYLHYLMNPSDHMIWLSFMILKELYHR